MAGCPHIMRGCKQKYPHTSIHHKYWPSTWYRTPLERAFRDHPRNKVRLCRCMHDLEHLKSPPKKPSIDQMKRFLGRK